jgi:hypothetical protein
MSAFKKILNILFLLTTILLSCKKKNEQSYKEYQFEFNETLQGWSVLFSDYPVGDENNFELKFEQARLPAPLDTSVKSIKVSGNNHSDDLLSMLYRKVDGLSPNTTYWVGFDIDLASNACKDCAGIGGSPNLCLGAGAISFPPQNRISSGPTPYYRPNFLSGIQGCQSNASLKVLGRIGVGNGLNIPYTLINLNNYENPIPVTTNSDGELWLLVGTDSGFEGITTIFYKKIKARLKK